MTEAELRNLRRVDLLKLFVEFSKEMESLKEELEQSRQTIEELRETISTQENAIAELEDAQYQIDELRDKLTEANRKLSERDIIMQKTGSIAEASLELNDVFISAQKAADQYLKSVNRKYEVIDEYCRKKEEEANKKASYIIAEAEKKYKQIILQAQIDAARI